MWLWCGTFFIFFSCCCYNHFTPVRMRYPLSHLRVWDSRKGWWHEDSLVDCCVWSVDCCVQLFVLSGGSGNGLNNRQPHWWIVVSIYSQYGRSIELGLGALTGLLMSVEKQQSTNKVRKETKTSTCYCNICLTLYRDPDTDEGARRQQHSTETGAAWPRWRRTAVSKTVVSFLFRSRCKKRTGRRWTWQSTEEGSCRRTVRWLLDGTLIKGRVRVATAPHAAARRRWWRTARAVSFGTLHTTRDQVRRRTRQPTEASHDVDDC